MASKTCDLVRSMYHYTLLDLSLISTVRLLDICIAPPLQGKVFKG